MMYIFLHDCQFMTVCQLLCMEYDCVNILIYVDSYKNKPFIRILYTIKNIKWSEVKNM